MGKRNLEFKGTQDVFDIQQKRMHSNHVCTRWFGIVSHQCEEVCHLLQDRTVQTWIEIGKRHERGNFTFKNIAHRDMIRVGMVYNVRVQFGQSIQWESVPGYIP